ncbi:MAG TPA: alpha/beta fold hydrolase [Longimicrobium sp.]|nr:alpha/beta fold hydrolase [Longimicrobium sp.]
MSTTATVSIPTKSTTDRSLSWKHRFVRRWFAALARVSPRLAGWHAARIFFTPHRRTRSAPGVLAGVRPDGLRVRVDGKAVVGWSYGRGPAILLVHGWGGCARDWAELAPRLIASGRRVVLVDLPAHGVSGGRRTALPDMVRAIHSIACELTFGPDDGFLPFEAVVAHSFGGAAAVLAAREGLLARRMVLVNPVGDPMSFADPVAHALGLTRESRAEMRERIRLRAGGDLARIDVVRAAAELAIPGLVIHDADDATVPCAQGRAIARAWPGARFATARGLGHRGALKDPAILAAIASFITGQPAEEPALAST